MTGPWHRAGMFAMFNQLSIFYLLLVNRHLCSRRSTVRTCCDSTHQLFISPLARPHKICLCVIRFYFSDRNSVLMHLCVCGGGWERGRTVWLTSELLSLVSRVNKQTVCAVNLGGRLNVVMFMHIIQIYSVH